MKTSAITSVFALLAAAATAAPLEKKQAFEVSLTFYGAGDANYSLSVPADDSSVTVDNPLSVSSIWSPGGGFCSIQGAEGWGGVLYSDETIYVGPPQPIAWVSCQNA
ncbi:hypothetical protein MPDQ_003707 [Monascus purpureus]|uniref:Uncharacterized protein n=1 Tax=Monascus purpureus TaxID=5098 RepID=A0A507QKF4_MONPU|nr:hypothetical protein MPDQ_003707 [Monascus purpureus]BDD54442.1 hypothetical protein MAP00_000060 [Monascus purpureus]